MALPLQQIRFPRFKGLNVDFPVHQPGDMEIAKNVDILIDGSLQQRLPHGVIVPQQTGLLAGKGIKKMYEFVKVSGTKYILTDVEYAGPLLKITINTNNSTGSGVTLSTWSNLVLGLITNDANRPWYCTLNNFAFRTDGLNANKLIYDDSYIFNCGVAAPTHDPTLVANTSGNLAIGHYHVYYRYQITDATRKRSVKGNPSEFADIDLTVGNDQIDVSYMPSNNDEVTEICFYRNLEGNEDYFYEAVARVPNSVKYLNAAGVAVNKGGGLVGLPSTTHGYGATGVFSISGTTNYDGEYTNMTSTADEIIITAAYVAEIFDGTETVVEEKTISLVLDDNDIAGNEDLEFDNAQPWMARFCKPMSSRMFYANFPGEASSGGGSWVGYSKSEFPEQQEGYVPFDPSDGSDIMGLGGPVQGNMVVFKNFKTYLLNPVSFQKFTLFENAGCVAPGSIQNAGDGKMFFLSASGVQYYDGSTLRNISYSPDTQRGIQSIIQPYVNSTKDYVDSMYYADLRQYHLLLFTRSATTGYLDDMIHLVYHIDSDSWTEYVLKDSAGSLLYETSLGDATDGNKRRVIITNTLATLAGTTASLAQLDVAPSFTFTHLNEYDYCELGSSLYPIEGFVMDDDTDIYWYDSVGRIWINAIDINRKALTAGATALHTTVSESKDWAAELPATAHGLTDSDGILVQGTVNYDGPHDLKYEAAHPNTLNVNFNSIVGNPVTGYSEYGKPLSTWGEFDNDAGQAAVNLGVGLVGFPTVNAPNDLIPGERVWIRLTGNSMEGLYTVHANTTANQIVITATYAAYTFSGAYVDYWAGAHYVAETLDGTETYYTLELLYDVNTFLQAYFATGNVFKIKQIEYYEPDDCFYIYADDLDAGAPGPYAMIMKYTISTGADLGLLDCSSFIVPGTLQNEMIPFNHTDPSHAIRFVTNSEGDVFYMRNIDDGVNVTAKIYKLTVSTTVVTTYFDLTNISSPWASANGGISPDSILSCLQLYDDNIFFFYKNVAPTGFGSYDLGKLIDCTGTVNFKWCKNKPDAYWILSPILQPTFIFGDDYFYDDPANFDPPFNATVYIYKYSPYRRLFYTIREDSIASAIFEIYFLYRGKMRRICETDLTVLTGLSYAQLIAAGIVFNEVSNVDSYAVMMKYAKGSGYGNEYSVIYVFTPDDYWLYRRDEIIAKYATSKGINYDADGVLVDVQFYLDIGYTEKQARTVRLMTDTQYPIAGVVTLIPDGSTAQAWHSETETTMPSRAVCDTPFATIGDQDWHMDSLEPYPGRTEDHTIEVFGQAQRFKMHIEFGTPPFAGRGKARIFTPEFQFQDTKR
jgi:hypothetical protein